MIVLDSAAAVDYLAAGAPYAWVESQVLRASSVHVPHVLDVEVVGALRRLVARGAVSRARAASIVAALVGLDLVRHGHLPLVDRMWELRDNVSASDAAFIALAEALDAPLVTTDIRLSRAPGLRIDVRTP